MPRERLREYDPRRLFGVNDRLLLLGVSDLDRGVLLLLLPSERDLPLLSDLDRPRTGDLYLLLS